MKVFYKHFDNLVAMNQLSKKYQMIDDEQRFENSKILM